MTFLNTSLSRLSRFRPSSFFLNLLKALVAGGLLLYLICTGQLDPSLLLSRPAGLLHPLGLGLVLLSLLLQAIRWWWLLQAQNVRLSFARAIQLSWIGHFFSLVLPGAAGGDLVRTYYIARDASSAKVASISTVLLDRVLGLYALLWIGLIPMLVFSFSERGAATGLTLFGQLIALLLGGATAGLLFLWFRPTRRWMVNWLPKNRSAQLESILINYQSQSRVLCAGLVLSVMAHILLMGAYLLASQVIGTPLSWQQVFFVVPLVIVSNSLPVSFGGLGVGEATAWVLFAQFGIPTGATIVLFVRWWLFLTRLPGGLIYLFSARDSLAA